MTETPTIRAVKEYISFAVVDLREYDFNEYVEWRKVNAFQGDEVYPINYDREAFYDYLPSAYRANEHPARVTLRVWHMWWDRFVEWAAALCDLCDRYDDWDDERHDPHLDAFI